VTALPSGLTTRVREIRTFDGAESRAGLHAAVTLVLDDALDISRGDMLVQAKGPPGVARALDATLCWLGDTPLDPQRTYLLHHTTREVRARVDRIDHLWNVATQVPEPAPARLARNDIGRVALTLAQPVFTDRYADNRATGSFILIDETTNNTVAAGMIE
jgi:sulfate adenylyltransferase subunit 1